MIGVLVKLLTGGLLDRVIGIYDKYADGKITKAQLDADVEKARIEAEKAAEAEFSKMAASIAESTQATVRASPVIQRAWAAGMTLQFFVLVWYQIGASAFEVYAGVKWPDPGISLGWGVSLLMTMVGGYAVAFRR